jgi:hypothetical protein
MQALDSARSAHATVSTVMSTSMQAKGIALLGAVAAMKADEELYRSRLRPHLRHYLDEPVHIAGWYPMGDYLELLRTLATTVDPKIMGGDPYRAFGIIAARRDLRGSQVNVPEDQRVEQAGLFRSAVDGGLRLSSRIRRGLWLRSVYYSTGHYEPNRSGTRSLRLVLRDFPLVCPELCRVGTGYLIEIFRSPPKGWVEKVSCRGDGASECAWELRFEDDLDPEELASFGSVPAAAPLRAVASR